MGHTATEKMFARKSGKKEVFPGDFVVCDADLLFAHSLFNARMQFDKIGGVKRVWNGDRVAFCIGHHMCLPSNTQDANAAQLDREFAKKYGVRHLYDMGSGNGHILMLEEGHAYPGAIVPGGDSHSTIYGAVGGFGTAYPELTEVLLTGKVWFKVPPTIRINLESATRKGVCARDVGSYLLGYVVGADGGMWHTLDFGGTYTHSLSIYQRMILSLLAIEMGGVTGFIEPDDITLDFVTPRARFPFEVFLNDPDCEFAQTFDVDVSKIEPLISCPPRPGNVKPVSEVEGVKIDQAYIGGCTGSSLEDFKMAAEILRGRKLHPGTRLIIVPGTKNIIKQLQDEGLIGFFSEMGAIISPPYCGPCQMICYGHLADGENMIGTHPRNLPGRGGSRSDVYLASPYTVAAAAITGKITDPRAFL